MSVSGEIGLQLFNKERKAEWERDTEEKWEQRDFNPRLVSLDSRWLAI